MYIKRDYSVFISNHRSRRTILFRNYYILLLQVSPRELSNRRSNPRYCQEIIELNKKIQAANEVLRLTSSKERKHV